MLVDAVPGFQVRRCPLLRNYAILQHNDLINTIYRTHSMCNDKYRLIPNQLGDRFLNNRLIIYIQRCGCFIYKIG